MSGKTARAKRKAMIGVDEAPPKGKRCATCENVMGVGPTFSQLACRLRDTEYRKTGKSKELVRVPTPTHANNVCDQWREQRS